MSFSEFKYEKQALGEFCQFLRSELNIGSFFTDTYIRNGVGNYLEKN